MSEESKVCRHCGCEIQDNDGYIEYFRQKEGQEEPEVTHGCRDCDKAIRIKDYEETGIIRDRIWMDATLIHHDMENGRKPADAAPWVTKLVGEMEPIKAVGKEWERRVWFGGHEPWKDDTVTQPYDGLSGFMDLRQYKEDDKGRRLPGVLPEGSLQALVVPARNSGFGAEVDGVKYLSYTMCGRSIFQCEDTESGQFVSVILDEDSPSPRGGIRSICATPKMAFLLLGRAITDWEAGLIDLQPNQAGFGF